MQDTPRLALLRRRPKRPGEASFFFFDHTFQVEACKVLPGEYFVYHEDIVIQTVLGSCVAACLVDRGAGIGGMNHFLLPEGDDSSARYGAFAMELLINELMKAGARRGSLEAKIFGGAAVIQGMTQLNVGKQNVEFVERFLAQERIPIVSKDVLDVTPRKVCLFPKSGRAMVKKLAPATAPSVASEEVSYRRSLKTAAVRGGAVELF
ncbi:MAG TPA: chemoreceptor glutamine deamidase CheD [Quisquiliibacterium sp.]|jgi:chemotaxis protein CheD|nr:chemoreceptor glutamine deamidase CheD [Quisquiliibacterium sp.]HPA89694.1 chemoreceptor glutamine deamidase CheD [Quisquiliibacterium sp.]HQD82669.1 chemoreceptor glutamine deamidase CheD [Quisquiliibacterium sp.]HQN10680.1 chemoreceptor glutamine deamidase CheD [Quisquiliibacterium sp.]HQP66282.1 chemoreceptor glutamine deamidase CheD [Quisquiliibacterium sp.]